MGAGEFLKAEWENEADSTRRILEKVPDTHLDWRPHPKSMSLGGLAQHIANLPAWCTPIFEQPYFDGPSGTLPNPKSIAEILLRFDDNSRKLSDYLEKVSHEALGELWRFGKEENPIFKIPRAAVIRSFLISHMIHHRGQLSVYLRLLDIPVPGMYGPSADEQRI